MSQGQDSTRGSGREADEAATFVGQYEADRVAAFYLRLVDRGVYADHARDITLTYLESELSKKEDDE